MCRPILKRGSSTLKRQNETRLSSASDRASPAAPAGDTAGLVRAGWRRERLVAVVPFPVTAHVETVALLVRDQGTEPSPAETGPPASS